MSIADDAGVMDAKLRGNIPALQQMAASGSMAALAALKEILDGQKYAQSLAQSSTLNIPEMAPVLQQLMGRGQPARTSFADGGAVEDGESVWSRAKRGYIDSMDALGPLMGISVRDKYRDEGYNKPLVGSVPAEDDYMQALEATDALGQPLNTTPSAYDPGSPPVSSKYRDEGRNKPLVGISSVGARPRAVPTGLAAAKALADSGNSDEDTQTRVSPGRSPSSMTAGSGADTTPPTPGGLEAYLNAQKDFATERSGLSQTAREQAQASLARGQKQVEQSGGIWGLLRNVAASPTSRALSSLGQGAVKSYDDSLSRGEKLNALQDAYDKHDMLLQQADLAARQGDSATEYKLRTDAAALAQKLQLEVSTMRMQNAHAGAYEGMEKRSEADARLKDRKGTGVGGSIKPMNPLALEARIQSAARAMLTQDKEAGKLDINHVPLSEEDAYNRASQRVRASVGAPSGATIPTNAPPSATGWGKATIK